MLTGFKEHAERMDKFRKSKLFEMYYPIVINMLTEQKNPITSIHLEKYFNINGA